MKSSSGLEDILGVTLTADWKTRIELIRVPVRIPILSTRIFSSALVGIKVLPKANMTMTNIVSLYTLGTSVDENTRWRCIVADIQARPESVPGNFDKEFYGEASATAGEEMD